MDYQAEAKKFIQRAADASNSIFVSWQELESKPSCFSFV